MYIRYLYKLRGLHVAANNFIEAGFTLKLHADQLQWSDDPLPAVLRPNSSLGPMDTHRAMKEALYNNIIDYFDRGNVSDTSDTVFVRCDMGYSRIWGLTNNYSGMPD